MRVLAIRGRNLASLEGEFSIDFTEEPLASAVARREGKIVHGLILNF